MPKTEVGGEEEGRIDVGGFVGCGVGWVDTGVPKLEESEPNDEGAEGVGKTMGEAGPSDLAPERIRQSGIQPGESGTEIMMR